MRRFRFQVVFVFLAFYMGALALVLSSMGRTLSVGGALGAEPTIIVDAGHGGFDGGAEGKNGTVEKDINLPIALKVRDLLTFYGFETVMTRETDAATCDEGIDGIANKKTSDILNRFSLIEQYPNAIFISIHQNKFPDSSSWGAQMFYGPQAEESRILAQTMQQNFVRMLQPENTREIKPAEESVYLLYHSPVPSVLVECGFLSNPDDEALLRTDAYQNKIAFVIAASVLEYFQQGTAPQMPAEDMRQAGI